jgi:hypothetical protein
VSVLVTLVIYSHIDTKLRKIIGRKLTNVDITCTSGVIWNSSTKIIYLSTIIKQSKVNENWLHSLTGDFNFYLNVANAWFKREHLFMYVVNCRILPTGHIRILNSHLYKGPLKWTHWLKHVGYKKEINSQRMVLHLTEDYVQLVNNKMMLHWISKLENTYVKFNTNLLQNTFICYLMLPRVSALTDGHFQGAFFSTCNLCFNLNNRNSTY